MAKVRLLKRKDKKKFFNDRNIVNVFSFAGIDFNYKEGVQNDFTVIITGLCDPVGDIYIVDLFRKCINGSELPLHFFNLYRKWNWKNVGIDANANQVVMKWLLQSWVGRPWNELYPGSMDNSKITAPLITEIDSEGRNKFTVIESVCGSNWRRLKFSENLLFFKDLKYEFKELRVAKHDDIPDAMTNLVRVVKPPPIIDLNMIDPKTGRIKRKKNELSPIELILELDPFEQILCQ